jgi:hypothetical protein
LTPYARRPVNVKRHTRRVPGGGRTTVKRHVRNVRKIVRSLPPLRVIGENHFRTSRVLLNLFSTSFPQYSPFIEAGRYYLNNRRDINQIISIVLKDIPLDDKANLALNILYQKRNLILDTLTNVLVTNILKEPLLKAVNDKEILTGFIENELNNTMNVIVGEL